MNDDGRILDSVCRKFRVHIVVTIVGALVLVVSGCEPAFSELDRRGELYVADPEPGETEIFAPGPVEFNMHYVPPKSFPTGPDDTGTSEVTEAYWIAETEVIYRLWDEVYQWASNGSGDIGAGEYTFANPGTQGNDGSQTDEHPVTEVNWRDAMAWTNALTEYYNAQTGGNLDPVYYTDSAYNTPIRSVTDASVISDNPGEEDNPYVDDDASGFRLPTSDEWELAARFIEDANDDGDIEDDDEYYPGTYASGATDDINNNSATEAVAWSPGFSGGTSAVAEQDANALGVHDMTGNVNEWNFDAAGTGRVTRGGSWGSDAEFLKLGRFGTGPPFERYKYDGLRTARNAE